MTQIDPNAFRVIKFGGSSVGNTDSLKSIVQTIKTSSQDSPLAIVVSAMGDTTDHLIEAMSMAASGQLEAAHEIVERIGVLAMTTSMMVLRDVDSEQAQLAIAEMNTIIRELLDPLRKILLGVSLLREQTAQSLDLVMSFGERLSATVVARLLRAHDVDAFFLDARTWTVTNHDFGQAKVDWPATQSKLDELRQSWPSGAVPICTGFLGQTPDGLTTTLGRNGSDYTATLLARALGAQEVNICTDVLGVMTADPRIVDDAYPVPHLSYLEALELANYGAKMFHPRTMLPLIESGIPMRIRKTTVPNDPGTVIRTARPETSEGPICVTSLEQLALVDVRWRQLSQQVQMGQRVLQALERKQITVWMATQAAHGQAVAVVVPAAQVEAAREAIEQELQAEMLKKEVEPLGVIAPVTLLSLVAEQMRESTNVAGRFFQTLNAVGVSVLAIAQGQSSRSISCVIAQEDTDEAVRTVHAAFNFAHQEVSLFLLGKGVVGGQLLNQIHAQAETLRQDHDIRLRLVGLADSKHVYFEPLGLTIDPETMTPTSAPLSENQPEHILAALERLKRLPVPVLIDCTSATLDGLYLDAFERHVHVVAANKKPLTINWAARQQLMSHAREHARAYHYETTVGASLPVIETLKNLVRTGDRVLRIEGSFSGTLGYLTNQVMAGQPLSAAVKQAKDLGYTEPQPQDDLSGLDVARKALILARELGLQMELDDVIVEPLVPAELLEQTALDAFFAALEQYDATFTEKINTMKSEGLTLRYLAIIDPGDDQREASLKVGPVAIPGDHPATHLRGSEAFVAFTTQRYQDYPLIVQGAGAGGAVTAAGVLADVLRIAQNLRGQ